MEEKLKKIQQVLELLIMGKFADQIEPSGVLELDSVIELINILSRNLFEQNEFVRNLSKGYLNAEIPGRRNYLAAPLKELHSQMYNYVWIADQIKAGKVVDRLDFAGEFGEALNTLVNMALYGKADPLEHDADSVNAVSNYKFHQLYLAFNHLKMMIIEADEDGKILFANKAAVSFFGECAYFDEDEVSEGARFVAVNVLSLMAQTSVYPQLYELFDDIGEQWYKITIDRIQLPSRDNVIMYMIENITDLMSNVAELKKDATQDELSSASNRRAGMRALEGIVKDARKDKAYCVAFVDMDKLKYINDQFGHVEGDFAIKSVAEAMMQSVRSADLVSRFGGDEFMVIFSDCSYTEAERAMTRMEKRIADLNESGLKPYNISFSYGLMEIQPEMKLTSTDIIMLLDKKMYENKSAKRDDDIAAV